MPLNITSKNKEFKFEKEHSIDTKSFCEEYLDLYKDCFGPRSYISEQWFRWHNLQAPYGINNIFTARNIENNEIASAYTLTPLLFCVNHKNLIGYLCCNVMTRPSYAGMGLFTKVGQYALNKQVKSGELVLGIPNESALKGHLKVGWQVMPPLYFIEKNKENFQSAESVNTVITEDLNLLEHFPFDHVNTNSTLFVKRDFGFIKWRYINNPKNKYLLVLTDPQHAEQGYAIIKVYTDDTSKMRKVHIVEYGYNNNMQLNEILTSIENYASSVAADLINTWNLCLTNSEMFRLFTAKNYVQTEAYNHLIIYADQDFTMDQSAWQLMLGDNDVF